MQLDKRRLKVKAVTFKQLGLGQNDEERFKAEYPYPNMETLFGASHKVAAFGTSPEEAVAKLQSTLDKIVEKQ